jgi:hypothetical protein
MRKIGLFIMMLLSLTLYSQSKKEVKQMMEEKCRALDSNFLEVITKNRWSLIYSMNTSFFNNKIKKIDYPSILEFRDTVFFESYSDKPKSKLSGKVYILDRQFYPDFIILELKSGESLSYRIRNVFHGKYFVVDVYLRNGTMTLTKTKTRLLYMKLE